MMLLDVGQGACLVLTTPNGRTVVVDPGEIWRRDVGREIIIPALRARGVREIDAVVLTSPRWSHTSALGELLDAFRVRRIVVGRGFDADITGEIRLARARYHGIEVTVLATGDAFELDGTRLLAVGPADGVEERSRHSRDDTSLSLLWQTGPEWRPVVLIPGDIRDIGMDSQIVSLTTRPRHNARQPVAVLAPRFGRPGKLLPDWVAAWDPRIVLVADTAPLPEQMRKLGEDRPVMSTFSHGAIRVQVPPGAARASVSHWQDGAWHPSPVFDGPQPAR